MATNLQYWKPLHKEGVACLPNQVLEDQLNMIDVPSAAADPSWLMSPAAWYGCCRAEVIGGILRGGGWMIGLQLILLPPAQAEAGLRGDDLLCA